VDFPLPLSPKIPAVSPSIMSMQISFMTIGASRLYRFEIPTARISTLIPRFPHLPAQSPPSATALRAADCARAANSNPMSNKSNFGLKLELYRFFPVTPPSTAAPSFS
jgi:hypothetical protein